MFLIFILFSSYLYLICISSWSCRFAIVFCPYTYKVIFLTLSYHIYVYVCLYIYTYVYIYIHMFIYIYTFTHISISCFSLNSRCRSPPKKKGVNLARNSQVPLASHGWEHRHSHLTQLGRDDASSSHGSNQTLKNCCFAGNKTLYIYM